MNTRSYPPGTRVAIQRILHVKITVVVKVLTIIQSHCLVKIHKVLHSVVEPHEHHIIQVEAKLEQSVPQQFPNLGMLQASRHSNR